ncbi:hypothetical protein MTO96_032477 [Rhipicephalus appendiculatus]
MCVHCSQTHVWPQGTPPRQVGLGSRTRAFLLRLRTDCSRTAERLFRLTGDGSPSCALCPAEETLEHILRQCPGYDDQRRQLFGAYGRLGLLHISRYDSTPQVLAIVLTPDQVVELPFDHFSAVFKFTTPAEAPPASRSP